jgi:hypothetical protein
VFSAERRSKIDSPTLSLAALINHTQGADQGTCSHVEMFADEDLDNTSPNCKAFYLLFSVFISIWAGIFISMWKRECVALCHKWNISLEESNLLDFREEFQKRTMERMQHGSFNTSLSQLEGDEAVEKEIELLKAAAGKTDYHSQAMKCVTVAAVFLQIVFLSILVLGLYLIFMYAFNMKLYCMCADLLNRPRSEECGEQFEVFGNRTSNRFDFIMYGAALAWGILIEWLNWRVSFPKCYFCFMITPKIIMMASSFLHFFFLIF